MPHLDLATLGWSPFFADAFAPHLAQGLAPARVATEDKHFYTVVGEQGDLIAVIAGKLHHRRGSDSALPKVGDWVAIARQPGEEKAVIHSRCRTIAFPQFSPVNIVHCAKIRNAIERH